VQSDGLSSGHCQFHNMTAARGRAAQRTSLHAETPSHCYSQNMKSHYAHGGRQRGTSDPGRRHGKLRPQNLEIKYFQSLDAARHSLGMHLGTFIGLERDLKIPVSHILTPHSLADPGRSNTQCGSRPRKDPRARPALRTPLR